MAEETSTAADEATSQAGSGPDASTPTPRQASLVALIGVVIIVLVIIAVLAVWLYVKGVAAEEAEAAGKIRELGGFVRASREGSVRTVSLSLPEAQENLDEIVTHLPKLRQIYSLEATGSPLKDAHLAAVGKLESLTSLVLNGTAVTNEGLAAISGLDNLQTLHLAGTNVTEAGLAHIAELDSLKILDVSETDISGDLSDLVGIPNLEWLLLRKLQLSDDFAETIGEIKSLSHLSLEGATLSPEAMKSIRQQRPNLKIDL